MTSRPLSITIPDDLDFATLKLARDPDGHVSFDWAPIEALCAVNGLDADVFTEGPEDNVSRLITAWYFAHRQRGGAPDPVQEDLIAETLAENRRGGRISHPPGRA